MKSLIKYVYNKLINNVFLITFAIILLLVALNHYIIFLLLIVYLIYMYKKDQTLFWITLGLVIVICLIFFYLKMYQNKLINELDQYQIEGQIIKIVKNDYSQKITIRYKVFKVDIYDYDFQNLNVGMIIKITGELKTIESNHIPNAFNYREYLYNNLYLGQYKALDIKIIKQQFSIYMFNDIVNKYLENNFTNNSLILIKAFIIGDSSLFSDSLQEAIKTNGIVHLFALSGLHITLFIDILEKVLSKFSKKQLIINIFLGIYLIITGFGVSISRAIITYYISLIFAKKKLQFTSLDRTSIVFIMFTIFNPYLMYNNGFVLSFFATFILLLISDMLSKKGKAMGIIYTSLFTTFLTFPILININYEINLLSPFINVLMIILVETIILPFTIICALCPFLKYLYSPVINSFIYIIEICAHISKKLGLVLIVGHMDYIFILLYYLLMLILFSKCVKIKKMLFIILFLLGYIINQNINLIRYDAQITFLDLYNGEATLIEYKNEKILIDTGEGINNEVTTYLKSRGINRLDYVIITHPHSDHNGEYRYLKENIKIKNVIKNKYDLTNYHINTQGVGGGDIVYTKYLKLEILNPWEKHMNENNNSLVIYTSIVDTSFLFLGDIEAEYEKVLTIPKAVDIVKIAHHGSNTSTTTEMLNKSQPQYAIIMNGRNSLFDFPHPETISKLNNKKIQTYITKNSYTIILKIKNKHLLFQETKK